MLQSVTVPTKYFAENGHTTNYERPQRTNLTEVYAKMERAINERDLRSFERILQERCFC